MDLLEVLDSRLLLVNDTYLARAIKAAGPTLPVFELVLPVLLLQGFYNRLELLLVVWLAHFALVDLAPMRKCSEDVLMLEIVTNHVLLVVLKLANLAVRDIGQHFPQLGLAIVLLVIYLVFRLLGVKTAAHWLDSPLRWLRCLRVTFLVFNIGIMHRLICFIRREQDWRAV